MDICTGRHCLFLSVWYGAPYCGLELVKCCWYRSTSEQNLLYIIIPYMYDMYESRSCVLLAVVGWPTHRFLYQVPVTPGSRWYIMPARSWYLKKLQQLCYTKDLAIFIPDYCWFKQNDLNLLVGSMCYGSQSNRYWYQGTSNILNAHGDGVVE